MRCSAEGRQGRLSGSLRERGPETQTPGGSVRWGEGAASAKSLRQVLPSQACAGDGGVCEAGVRRGRLLACRCGCEGQ